MANRLASRDFGESVGCASTIRSVIRQGDVEVDSKIALFSSDHRVSRPGWHNPRCGQPRPGWSPWVTAVHYKQVGEIVRSALSVHNGSARILAQHNHLWLVLISKPLWNQIIHGPRICLTPVLRCLTETNEIRSPRKVCLHTSIDTELPPAEHDGKLWLHWSRFSDLWKTDPYKPPKQILSQTIATKSQICCLTWEFRFRPTQTVVQFDARTFHHSFLSRRLREHLLGQ